jgi:LmbE family N-acetylglucosaminyl deacetylase
MRSASGVLLLLSVSFAQERPLANGAAQVRAGLDRLRATGSVLMIAAHPDDENTAVLAYFARGRHFRTGYLSLTRGEGGQNLIGAEQGEWLGVIRTQELLAARRLDGAEQFFSRAVDFGFSKTAEETLAKWGREKILGDAVWVIRTFQPDVILLRFSGTPRDGHGHHQSSAILGKEAFEAAADPARFPGQKLPPWRARRVLWNAFSFTREMEREAEKTARLSVDTGEFDPILGYSYGEIAGMSRSMHRSQGMGAAERRGSMRNFFTVVAGEPATQDVFEGVDTTWNRLPGGAAVDAALKDAIAAFDIARPAAVIPALMKARREMAKLDHPAARRKIAELDELAVLAAGLWLDASAAKPAVTPGESYKIQVTAVNRSNTPARLEAPSPATLVYNQPFTASLDATGPALRVGAYPDDCCSPERPPLAEVTFRVAFEGGAVSVTRPVRHRYVDNVRGELWRPVEAVPPVSLSFGGRSLLFPDAKPKRIEVTAIAHAANARAEVALDGPAGWKIEPASQAVNLARAGEQAVLAFTVTPPSGASTGELRARGLYGVRTIAYDHIPPQTVVTPASLHVTRADVRTLSRRIGYIMGAGDEMPEALRQWGAEVTLLSDADLERGGLSAYDAIVTGVRAYNVRPALRANHERLLEFTRNGGAFIVQYNTATGGPFGRESDELDRIGPYPLATGRARTTVEESPLVPLDPAHPLLNAPNRITAADYEGWVQERGLYFASKWDERYTPLWESHDPGEPEQRGATLTARYGKGVYVFTPMSWFRQLPAGVPGAHRIFANFVSAAKAAP